MSEMSRIVFVPLLVLLLIPFLLIGENVHGQTGSFSTVYIKPVQLGGPAYKPSSSSFTINVMTNLTLADTINTFDVILNYSNYGIVEARPNVNFTGNIFQGSSPSIECVDGISVNGGSCSGIGQGSIHIVEGIAGSTVSGIQEGLLFSVQFSVQKNGTSVFSLGQANLINPYGTGDPSVIDPVYVHSVSMEGVFANLGLIAFFNYKPSYSPAILPGEQIVFDASGSFNASFSGGGIASYSWSFGDQSSAAGATASHAFSSPSTYQVTLSITSKVGGPVVSTSRSVVVVPALGQLVLRLAESKDRSLPARIQVQIFNSSSSAFPFQTGTSNSSHIVVFQNLQAGSYFLKISAPGIQDHNAIETVEAGLPTTATIYLDSIPTPPSPPGYGYLFYLVPLVGGVAVVSVLMLRRARSNRSARRERVSRRSSAR
jgi:hypothetical protein